MLYNFIQVPISVPWLSLPYILHHGSLVGIWYHLRYTILKDFAQSLHNWFLFGDQDSSEVTLIHRWSTSSWEQLCYCTTFLSSYVGRLHRCFWRWKDPGKAKRICLLTISFTFHLGNEVWGKEYRHFALV